MFVVSIGVLILAFVVSRPDPLWDPLGDYPVQQVTGPTPHAFSVSDPAAAIPIRAIKCNNSDRPVKVRGTVEWRRVSPLGQVIAVGGGTAERTPGCQSFNYENTIPAEVRESVLTNGTSTWQISGEETPIREDGTRGESRAWQSENFKLVP